jgi:hypothetical protein
VLAGGFRHRRLQAFLAALGDGADFVADVQPAEAVILDAAAMEIELVP